MCVGSVVSVLVNRAIGKKQEKVEMSRILGSLRKMISGFRVSGTEDIFDV